jgi:hypothetical protein
MFVRLISGSFEARLDAVMMKRRLEYLPSMGYPPLVRMTVGVEDA